MSTHSRSNATNRGTPSMSRARAAPAAGAAPARWRASRCWSAPSHAPPAAAGAAERGDCEPANSTAMNGWMSASQTVDVNEYTTMHAIAQASRSRYGRSSPKSRASALTPSGVLAERGCRVDGFGERAEQIHEPGGEIGHRVLGAGAQLSRLDELEDDGADVLGGMDLPLAKHHGGERAALLAGDPDHARGQLLPRQMSPFGIAEPLGRQGTYGFPQGGHDEHVGLPGESTAARSQCVDGIPEHGLLTHDPSSQGMRRL